MPLDAVGDAVGEVVGAAFEAVVESFVEVPEPPKRSRFWRFIYWSVVALIVGFLLVVAYLALS